MEITKKYKNVFVSAKFLYYKSLFGFYMQNR